jgi:hypothetical protein
MTVQKRVYVVSGGAAPRLVKAVSQAAAIGHVVKSAYKATVATQDDLIAALGAGAKVELAGDELPEPPHD